MEKFLAAAVLILIVLGSHGASADTFSVPNDFATISAALSVAKSGDVVQLQPGNYHEYGMNLPGGVSLTGMGENPQETIIDAQGQGNILHCFDDRAPSVVYNLTLKNGRARGETSYDQSGGAIYVNRGDLRIINCDFIGNQADSHGGAIRCIQASPEITGCNFLNNSALTGGGGALDCSYNASPLVKDCTFISNLAAWGGALSCRGNSDPEVVAGFFQHNQAGGDQSYGGGALAFFDSAPEFTLCTFYDNQADYGGALAFLPGAPALLNHCTLTENRAEQGGGLYCRDSASTICASIITFHDGSGITGTGTDLPDVSWSNIHGNSSGDLVGLADDLYQSNGNISSDPLFCGLNDLGEMRFSLYDESPCVTETDECGTMGAWLTGCAGSPGIQPIAEAPRVLSIENVRIAPNPFNPLTRIRFELESNQRIRVEIFSINGRRVRILADQVFTAGWNTLAWHGKDESGRQTGSGIYLVRIQGEAVAKTHKITLLK